MLSLVILEISSLMTPSTREVLWRLDLSALASLLLVVQPVLLGYTITAARGWSWRVALFVSIVGEAGFLFLTWRLGQLFPLTRPPSRGSGLGAGETQPGGLEGVVGRLGMLGVTVAAVLSGYGAVASPYNFITLGWSSVTPKQVSAKRIECRRLLDRVAVADRKLLAAQPSSGAAKAAAGEASLAGALAEVLGCGPRPGSGAGQAQLALRAEVGMLRALLQHEHMELVELLQAQERMAQARTLQGRLLRVAGVGLSGYGVYRVIISTLNVLLSRDPTSDPITTGLRTVLLYYNIPNAASLVQPLSFLAAGGLMLSSVQGFLSNSSKLFRAYSSANLAAPMGLVLSTVMGSYFLAMVLLVRKSLPDVYRGGIVAALGPVQWNFFYRWFDATFIVAAVITLLALLLFTAKYSLIAAPAQLTGAVAGRGHDEQLGEAGFAPGSGMAIPSSTSSLFSVGGSAGSRPPARHPSSRSTLKRD